MQVFKVKGADESWKEAKNNLEEEVNKYRPLGIRFVGITENKGKYSLAYENNGKLSFTAVKLSTKGLSMPFKPCMKYIEALIFYNPKHNQCNHVGARAHNFELNHC